MLIVLINKASKLSDYFLTLEKEYTATIKLGIKTDTRDISGKVLETRKVEKINEKKVKEVLGDFTGRQMQIPPVYSALKYKGKPLYKLAREGKEVSIKKRAINISSLELISLEGDELAINVICSSGTYIRSLAHDIGLALDTGGTLKKLNRTRIGNFLLKDSTDIQDLLKEELAARDLLGKTYIIFAEKVLAGSRDIYIYDEYIRLVRNGHPLIWKMIDKSGSALQNSPEKGDYLVIRDKDGGLLAIHQLIYEGSKFAETGCEDKKYLSKSIVIF